MAAPDEPAEDVIDNVCSLTGLTRAQAVLRLKVSLCVCPYLSPPPPPRSTDMACESPSCPQRPRPGQLRRARVLTDSPRPTATTPTVWYPNSSTTRTAPSTLGTSRSSEAAAMATSLTTWGSVGRPGDAGRAIQQRDLLGPCSVQYPGPGCCAADEPPQQCCSDPSSVPNQQPVSDG